MTATATAPSAQSASTWRGEAACAGLPAEMFVPAAHPQGKKLHRPPAPCAECVVAKECLAFGLRTASCGWWGGTYLRGIRYDDPLSG